MSRNTAPRCFRVAASSAALAVVLPFASRAQQQPAQGAKAQWSVITVSTVKPEMRDQFEAFQKELMMAFKKAEVPSRVVLQPAMGDLLEYVTIYPIANLLISTAHLRQSAASGKMALPARWRRLQVQSLPFIGRLRSTSTI